jgi:hypothetical protein
MLVQLRQQFNVVHPGDDFSKFSLLVLPDHIPLEPGLSEKLKIYLAHGGKLLATALSGLHEDGTRPWLPLGIEPQGWSHYTTSYFRFVGMESDHVMYERGSTSARPWMVRFWLRWSNPTLSGPGTISPRITRPRPTV